MMTGKYTWKLVLLTGAIVLGGVAAEARGANGAALFEEIDADGNGSVTEAELTAHATARFARADANGDGFLSEDEIGGAREGRNSDRAARMLERYDTDNNGSLDAQELEAVRNARSEGGRENRRGSRMMDRLDTNNDGQLDFAEVTAPRDPARMIERLDTNGNGTVEAEEFEQARGNNRRSDK